MCDGKMNVNKKTKMTAAMSAMIFMALIVHSTHALAADPTKGKSVFNVYKACHSLKAGKKKIGPSLFGVVGRKAGSSKGFSYSSAMKKAGKNGLVWTEETLNKYLKSSRKFVPGNRMPFPGLGNKTKRSNLIAFLKSVGK